MSWLLYPPYTLAFLVIVVLGAIGVLAVRKREAAMAYGSGCGLLLIATLVYLLTAVLSGFACANNPCGGTVSVLLTYAAPPFIASIFTGLAAVGLLIFGAVTDWQSRDNVRAGATATTRSTAVAQSRLSQRRAIDARAQQIVEESGALWAVARDQAKAELGSDSIPSSPSASWQDALSAVVIAAVSAVLLVVVFFVFAFVAAVACGGLFDSMAPLNTPCDRRAENGYVVWLAFTACGFVASFVLAFTKRQPAWMFAPVIVGVTAAIVIGTVLVAAA